MEIYLQQDAQQKGPYTEQQLLESVSSGAINAFDLAKLKESNEWLPLCTIIQIEGSSPALVTPHLPPPPSQAPSSGAPDLPPPTFGGASPSSQLPPPDLAFSAASSQTQNPVSGVSKIKASLLQQGAIIGGWIFFLIGCVVLVSYSGSFYVHYSLFVLAVILSIEVFFQRRVLAGLSLLLATLIVPSVIGFALLFYQINYSELSVADEVERMSVGEKAR